MILSLWLLAAGCPKPSICVTASDDSAAALTLTLGKGTDCAETPKISSFTVSTVPSGEVLWHFTSDGVALSTVAYGVLPDGFEHLIQLDLIDKRSKTPWLQLPIGLIR